MALSTIMPANSVSGGYEIDNSLRFNRGDTAVLRKTFSGSPTATQKCTISFWTKLADPSVTDQKEIFSAIKSGSSEDRIGFHAINNGIHGGFELAFNNGNDGAMYIGTGGNTLVRFRDSSAWYHFVIAIDSTQGTASNRVKVYINGVLNEVESRIDGGAITNDVVLTQNYALGFLTAGAHSIGENVESAGTTPYDGYLADFNFIDGTQNAHTDFGEVDDNGEWIPKKYTGSYGNYGFFMEFKQTGTGTNASGMGADTSGNDNHFAPVNLAATDITTDTPTNNFATFNALLPHTQTLSEGNTKVSNATDKPSLSTLGVASGKWYAEIKFVSGTHCRIGFANENGVNEGFIGANSWIKINGQIFYHDSSGITSQGQAISAGDTIIMAVDVDAGKLWWGKNGTWDDNASGTGDPANGTNPTYTDTGISDGGFIFFGVASGSGAIVYEANFGNPPYAISSSNADANDYGNFEYAVPSGYYSLCTKNLGEFG